MIIKECENARLFLQEYETVMLEEEAVSQLLILCARRATTAETDGGKLYGAVQEEEETILLFGNSSEEGLYLYPVQNDKSEAAVLDLACFLTDRHIAVTSLHARLFLCQSFINSYRFDSKTTFVQKQGTDIMEIRNTADIIPIDGHQRLATPLDAKQIADWMINFQIEAMMNELDYEAALQRVEEYIGQGKFYLYENLENEIVSMAASGIRLIHGITITYIYTPQEHRGKGYAAANIFYLSKALLEQGYEFCSIFVDKKNVLSCRAYEKAGYQVIGENFDFSAVEIIQER